MLLIVSCGNDSTNLGSDSDSSIESTDTNGLDSSTENKDSDSGNNSDADTPKEIRVTVTEEEWNKIMHLEGVSSFTLSFSQTGNKETASKDKEAKYYYSNGIAMQQYKRTMTVTSADGSFEEYDVTYDPYYQIEEETLSSLASIDLKYADIYSDFFEYYEEEEFNFSLFVFDEETKSYTYDFYTKSNLPPFKINLYFEDGFLVKFTAKYENVKEDFSEKYDVLCAFSDWNKTELQYPEQITELYSGYVNAISNSESAVMFYQGTPVMSSELVSQLSEFFASFEAKDFLYESLYEDYVAIVCASSSVKLVDYDINYNRIVIFSNENIDDIPSGTLIIVSNAEKPFYIAFCVE